MDGCNFCLENNNIKGEILAKNKLCYFVESICPVLKHAGMIITYRHVSSPFDINQEEWSAIRELLEEARVILDRHKPSGYSIGWNVGEDAGQHNNHAHLHIIARFPDEPLRGKGIRWVFQQESNRRLSEKAE
jgi:diadenosine tetraphosphate (Ap4A) HIT family hydrolase